MKATTKPLWARGLGPHAIAFFCGQFLFASVASAAQPGGAMPGQGGAPGGGQGDKEDKDGPAESAPKDRGMLSPITPVPAFPRHFRRVQLFELHGYFRARADYFHRLSLGRNLNSEGFPGKFFYPASQIPETGSGNTTGLKTNSASCFNRLNAQGAPRKRIERCQKRDGISSANLRLRLRPTIHVTEGVRVHTMFDVLDNVVLGSTPESYLGQNPYAPIDLFARGQHPPSAGLNGFNDSIVVKQAYGEVNFSWGLNLKFGRMPQMWGLGIVYHDGEGAVRGEVDDRIRRLDNDYGDAVDGLRLAYNFGRDRRQSHRLTLGYDWAASGPTTAQLLGPGWSSGQRLGQAISVDKHDKVHQLFLSLERKDSPYALKQKQSLDVPVLNYGVAAWLRFQTVDRSIGAPGLGDGLGYDRFNQEGVDPDRFRHLGSGVSPGGLDVEGDNGLQNYAESLVNRRAIVLTPDVWMRVNWRTLRVELEAAAVVGKMHHRDLRSVQTFDVQDTPASERSTFAQIGYALEIKHGVFNDRFNFGLDHGFATGQDSPPSDSDLASPFPSVDDSNQARWAGGRLSSFRFNPAYVNDLLLFRELLGTHANAVYFKPWLSYAFFRNNASFRLDLEYAVAHRTRGAPGSRRSYGFEADAALRYHDTQKPIFTQLQYGIMLPLRGLYNRPKGQGLRPTQTIQLQAGIEF